MSRTCSKRWNGGGTTAGLSCVFAQKTWCSARRRGSGRDIIEPARNICFMFLGQSRLVIIKSTEDV